MRYTNVSVKFPEELDAEIERFLDETGVYTNKSEFIKEACRTHLRRLNDEQAIAARRLEQLLARAEASTQSDAEIERRLDELGSAVDAENVAEAVNEARSETAARFDDA